MPKQYHTFIDIFIYSGSGGNNHAVEYYNETKYPLAVKLGTITGEGGDVYSYPEDNMVIDPKLKEHLQHFGINITQMEKVRFLHWFFKTFLQCINIVFCLLLSWLLTTI